MKSIALLCAAIGLFGGRAFCAESPTAAASRETLPNTWAATDALGRKVPTAETVGPPRTGRFVAMFYFLWLDAAEKAGPFDNSRIIAADPAAMAKTTSPPWGPLRAMHHWGEPLFGYYLSDDAWVLRKHAQMLSDAGVDVIIFDTSNRLTYRRNYTSLIDVFRRIRHEGGRTPQIAFLTPFGDPRATVHELYEQLYSKHLGEELWFRWEDKPLILADPGRVDAAERKFFTFRRAQPDYFRGPTGPDMWSWLEVYPQHVFKNSRGEKEQMSVGVAQNAVGGRLGSMSEPGSRGRSFHDGKVADAPDAGRGYNFAEQWERALKEDPQLIFVTGWNEWVAGRFDEFNRIKTPPMFVDEFDAEHSRDIEPMKGGFGDNYYYQLVSYIRRFKGARALPAASAAKTIHIDGGFDQWEDVQPEYRDDLFDTVHRDHPGFAHAGPYADSSGRNDLDLMKVAHDKDNISFYVRTREPMTEPAGDNWMTLLLDTDRDHKTGWEGYDFIVNRSRSDSSSCTVERNMGGWRWETVAKIPVKWHGNELQLAIPRTLLGLKEEKLSLEFKWTDNVPSSGNILDLLDKGDAAPNGRFNYVYHE
jgi:hypothetical protein